MKKLISSITILISLNFASANNKIKAPEIFKIIKNSQLNSEIALDAKIVKSIPYTKRSKQNIKLYFYENTTLIHFTKSDKKIKIDKNNSDYDIQEKIGNSQAKSISKNLLNQNIENTDFTYGDLSFQFLYWENSKIINKNSVFANRLMWKIEVQNPNKNQEIKKYHIWVDKKAIAISKIEAFKNNDSPYKRISIIAVHKINKLWTIKTMKVEKLKVINNRLTVNDMTHLYVKKP